MCKSSYEKSHTLQADRRVWLFKIFYKLRVLLVSFFEAFVAELSRAFYIKASQGYKSIFADLGCASAQNTAFGFFVAFNRIVHFKLLRKILFLHMIFVIIVKKELQTPTL